MSRPDIEGIRERFLRPIESSEQFQEIWAHLVFARNDVRVLLDYVAELEAELFVIRASAKLPGALPSDSDLKQAAKKARAATGWRSGNSND